MIAGFVSLGQDALRGEAIAEVAPLAAARRVGTYGRVPRAVINAIAELHLGPLSSPRLGVFLFDHDHKMSASLVSG